MAPHTTNVPAEKNPMNNERPLIPHGTEPPAEKNVKMSFCFPEKDNPATRTPAANNKMAE